eukprot:gene10254-1851_t
MAPPPLRWAPAAIVALSASLTVAGPVVNVSNPNDVVARPFPRLVIFQVPWCTDCVRMTEILHEVAKRFPDNGTGLVYHSVDDHTLLRKFKVGITPTVRLYISKEQSVDFGLPVHFTLPRALRWIECQLSSMPVQLMPPLRPLLDEAQALQFQVTVRPHHSELAPLAAALKLRCPWAAVVPASVIVAMQADAQLAGKPGGVLVLANSDLVSAPVDDVTALQMLQALAPEHCPDIYLATTSVAVCGALGVRCGKAFADGYPNPSPSPTCALAQATPPALLLFQPRDPLLKCWRTPCLIGVPMLGKEPEVYRGDLTSADEVLTFLEGLKNPLVRQAWICLHFTLTALLAWFCMQVKPDTIPELMLHTKPPVILMLDRPHISHDALLSSLRAAAAKHSERLMFAWGYLAVLSEGGPNGDALCVFFRLDLTLPVLDIPTDDGEHHFLRKYVTPEAITAHVEWFLEGRGSELSMRAVNAREHQDPGADPAAGNA